MNIKKYLALTLFTLLTTSGVAENFDGYQGNCSSQFETTMTQEKINLLIEQYPAMTSLGNQASNILMHIDSHLDDPSGSSARVRLAMHGFLSDANTHLSADNKHNQINQLVCPLIMLYNKM